MRVSRSLLATTTLAFVCACGPIGPFAGGALSGEVEATGPTDWGFAEGIETAQLETRPSDPHSINCWFASVGPALYVPTSMILGPKDPTERGWVSHVTQDARVRIRIDGRIHERQAVRVDDGAEYEAARAALEAKYALTERDPERTIWIYRLDPRAAGG